MKKDSWWSYVKKLENIFQTRSSVLVGVLNFDSINWIGSLISNSYYCSCEWCGPWASYYFTWWMLKWAFFFFYQNVFCLLVVSVCLKFIFHHFQSQCVLVYRARRGRGICYQIQIIVQSLQKGEIFQIFFKLKRQVLD